jgi:purine-binding chemotaxis protein CheW
LPDAFLLLDVAGTACALPRTAVGEILPLPDLFRPPAAGAWLSGFLDLGGRVVPVIDLAQLLGLRPGPVEAGLHAHLVLVAGRDLAYQVERAADIVAVEASSPVDPDHSLNGCVAGEIRLGGRLVHVLDPARLLGAEERIRVEAATRAAAARLAALPTS